MNENCIDLTLDSDKGFLKSSGLSDDKIGMIFGGRKKTCIVLQSDGQKNNVKVPCFKEFVPIHDDNSNESYSRHDLHLSYSTERDSSSDYHGINLENFFDSPLLHESSKNVALGSENIINDNMLLDASPSKHSNFSGTPEISDELFSTSLMEHSGSLSGRHSVEMSMFCDSSEHSTNETSDKLIDENSEISGKKSPLSSDDFTEYKSDKESESSIIVSNNDSKLNFVTQNSETRILDLKFSSLQNNLVTTTTDTSTLVKPASESSRVIAALGVPLTTVDIGVMPVITADTIVFGTLPFLPNSSTPLKLQIIQGDGTLKTISMNAICTTAPANIKETVTSTATAGTKSVTSSGSSILLNDAAPSTEPDRPFKCELCSATFNRFGNYTRHKKIHTVPSKEDQRFQCDVCGKNFIQRCDLTRHMHIHSGTEPHRCSICGKGYIRHSDLVTHQRFHNKEKPFTCPHCTKGFCQKGDLNRHLRSIHLQLKPLTCGHCQKKFAKETTLIRHMQTNHHDLILESLVKSRLNEQANNTMTSLPLSGSKDLASRSS